MKIRYPFGRCVAVATLVLAVLTIAFMPATIAWAAIDESEPNDSFAQANKIPLNKAVYGEASARFGCFDSNHDEDFYKMNLPASGSVTITFVNDMYEKSTYNSDQLYIYVHNKYYEEVKRYTVTTRNTRPDKTTISLSKGVNYIRIHASQYNKPNHPYHFKITYSIPRTTTKLSARKKAFTVSWARKSGAAKYQIRYSTNKSMKNVKIINVSKNAKTKYIGKLKAKKRYYVQVRVVKSIGGILYYSPWSTLKSVVTKS